VTPRPNPQALKMSKYRPAPFLALAAILAGAAPQPAAATEFSVSPIRVELKPGAMSETITVTNYADAKLRLSMKLVEWTQDAAGNDVYKESSDLVYFPRQMDMEPNAKRLIRLGAKVPSTAVERTYRLWVEEEPDAAAGTARAQVSFFFKFGVPVFLPPPGAKARPEVMEPTLAKGRLAIVVKNPGNKHFRLTRLTISDEAGFQKEVGGWYSLAGSERTYAADIPPDVCRKAKAFTVLVEGEEGLRLDRKLHVDPAGCA
jgi:fimbrial chaperone protein